MGEGDNQDPNHLVVALTRLFCRALDEHPYPENGPHRAKRQESQLEQPEYSDAGTNSFHCDCLPPGLFTVAHPSGALMGGSVDLAGQSA